MSSIDPIEVPEDLPESHVHELLRLETLDAQHGVRDHRTNPNPCLTCKIYLSAMRSIAEGNTSEMIEAVEKVARKLALQAVGGLSELDFVPFDSYWGIVLSESKRKDFRTKAAEIIEALGANYAVLPSGAKA